MEADPLEIAREVLRTERTRYYGQPERSDEVLAQALLAKHAEVGRLREALMVLEDNAGDMAERAGSSADAAAFRCLVEIARAALAQEAGK